jgi:RNA polymerase sigma-54 factor
MQTREDMMQLSQSVRLKQKQSMVMTPRLQQAIRMLQMSNIDLAQYLEDQALENPFLELDKREGEAVATTDRDAESVDQAMTSGASMVDDPTAPTDFDNRHESGDSEPVWRAELSQGRQGGDFEAASMGVAERAVSIYTHVSREIELLFADAQDKLYAYILLERLAPSGWLSANLEDIAAHSGVATEKLEPVLLKLQEMEPVGIFARGLGECLRLQAKDQNCLTPALDKLLNHLDVLAAGDFKALTRKCGCSEDEIRNMLSLIRSFTPKPGEAFLFADEIINSPDLIAFKSKNGWVVELNNSTLPAIKIDENYAEELAKKIADRESQEFTNNALSSARWLKRALEQRNSTTLIISAEIIRQQTEFLENGLDALKPLLLRNIAKAVGMHESTVSRVTTGLMISTPRGSFPLKAFFSVALAGEDGDEDSASAAAVRHMISKMISEENPQKPLSDDAIAAQVTKEGIRLARRTVAKYRQILKIPSSAERRRRAKLAKMS